MAAGERINHILESQQFSRDFLEETLFPEASSMEEVARKGGEPMLKGWSVGIVFYEPSTRTRVSFERAIRLLGGDYYSTENAAEFSSAVKGESIEDTVRIYQGYHVDGLVIRHKEAGALARAAAISDIPIISAGEGTGQHPTQSLLDVYTIQERLGRVDNLKVVMVGDAAHGRTVNSLAYLLAKFDGNGIDFVFPKGFGPQEGIKEYLQRHNVSFTEGKSLVEAVKRADVVYMTRPQLERMTVTEKEDYDPSQFILGKNIVDMMPKDSIILHPLPRNEELPVNVDSDPRAAYFRQAQNGLYVRMALLDIVLRNNGQ
jgi:aspartate carbamoyltransferase catalytic subunit